MRTTEERLPAGDRLRRAVPPTGGRPTSTGRTGASRTGASRTGASRTGASPAAERLRRLHVDDRRVLDRRSRVDDRTVGTGATALSLAPAVPQPKPEPPRPRHLRVVEPGTLTAAQRRRRARAVLMGAIGAASFIGFALVYLHVVLAQRQFGVDRLNTKVQQEQAAYQNLRLQVAELGSPAQIIATAVGQLGMVQPSGVTYVAPSAGTTSSTPAPGASAAAGSGTSPGPFLGRSPGASTGAASSATTTPDTVAPLGVRPASGSAAVPAPAGDANWPTIKSQLAGLP